MTNLEVILSVLLIVSLIGWAGTVLALHHATDVACLLADSLGPEECQKIVETKV